MFALKKGIESSGFGEKKKKIFDNTSEIIKS